MTSKMFYCDIRLITLNSFYYIIKLNENALLPLQEFFFFGEFLVYAICLNYMQKLWIFAHIFFLFLSIHIALIFSHLNFYLLLLFNLSSLFCKFHPCHVNFFFAFI